MVLFSCTTAAVSVVPPVHQQVDKRTKQEQRERSSSEDVRSVLSPKEEQGYGQEQAEAQHPGNVKGVSSDA